MNLALFDFDGTITSSDTWTPFMRAAIRPARIIAGGLLGSPIFLGYRLGVVSASRARQTAVRVGLQGTDAATVRCLGVEYATTALPRTMRPHALERIEWHRTQGDHVVIVSGSLDVYVAPWCAARGLDCICSALEERGGRLTGRYVGGDCSGQEKVRRVRQRYDFTQYSLVYAYGDSGEDREMLELAHRKYYRWREIANWDEVTSYGHVGEGKAV